MDNGGVRISFYNTKSAEYVVSLSCKQNIGLGNCQKTEGCEDSPVKGYKTSFLGLCQYFFVTIALKIHNFF